MSAFISNKKILVDKFNDFYAMGQYFNALECAQTLLMEAQNSNDVRVVSLAYIQLMQCYYNLGEMENAFECIAKFRLISEDHHSCEYKFYLQIINGYIYEYEENFPLAIQAVQCALSIELNNPEIISHTYNFYTSLLCKNGQYDLAHKYALINHDFIHTNLSTHHFYKTQNQHLLAIAMIHQHQEQKAFLLLEALKKNPIIEYNLRERSYYFFTYGSYYLKIKNYEQALLFYAKSEKLAFKNNDTALVKQITKMYADIHSLRGDFKQAYMHLQKYTHLLEQKLQLGFLSKTHELDLKQSAYLLERNANLDSLSGLSNRSYLEKTTNKWLQVARQNKDHICCIVFDVDNFKVINDTYGHLYGDEVIKHVGYCCKELFNTNNCLCARYGGDEFVIVLKNVGRENIRPLTQQLFTNITNRKIAFEHVEFTITVSMGVVCTDVYPSKRFTQLFKVADQALYMAKRQGKNQILAMINNNCSL